MVRKLYTDPPSDEEDDDPTTVAALPTEFYATRVSRDDAVCGTLTVMTGPEAGHMHLIRGDEARIGRSPQCQLRLFDNNVSRAHARVFFESSAASWVLEDLGSQNGTFLEDRRIDRVPLNDGAMFRVGPIAALRFEVSTVDQARLRRRLYETSTRDPLTSAFNRKYFEERLQSEVSFALRHDKELAVLMMDIDHFKRVNDQYGHSAGDEVLKTFARTIQLMIRAEDVFCRQGGEEFVLLARGIPPAGAMRVAERIRIAVERMGTTHEDRHIPVTVSIGVAMLTCVGKSRDLSALVAKADERLYEAKHTGRNRVVGPEA